MTDSGASVDDLLGEDHEKLGKVLEALTESVLAGSPKASAILAEFSRGLACHMKWEEEGLFPAVREHATPEERRSIESLEIDHERIRGTLAGLGEALGAADGERARELVGLLDTYLKGHNYDEEHGVYAEADRYLPAGERNRLLEKFRAAQASSR